MSHTLTSIIPMNADSFYAITETTEFDIFQIPYMGLNSLELKEEREEEDLVFRRVCVKPNTSVPKILLKFANGQSEVSYIDTQIKSKLKREIMFKTTPPLLADHIHIEGIITVEPLDENTCLKVMKVTFRFTGPLAWFSSIIENNILSELKKTMETLPKVVIDYKKHLDKNGIPMPLSKLPASSAPIQTTNTTASSNSSSSSSSNNYNTRPLSSPKSPIVNKEPVAQYV
eukprot:gene17531-20920_t